MNFDYYKSTRFSKVFYAKDDKKQFYVFRGYSWVAPEKYWQRASWQDEIAFIKNEIGHKENTMRIAQNDLEKFGIPRITPQTSKIQPLYEYFQDNEEDWIYLAKNEGGNIYLYRNPNHPHYADSTKPQGKWERITDEGFKKYCLDTVRAMSQSSPRTDEYLTSQGVPLIELNDVVLCTLNHI